MIAASKSRAFERVFHIYNKRLLRKHFHALHVGGLEHVQSLDRSRPTILVGNHSCWWDGLIELFLATEVLHLNGYCMMEEKQMVRYKFFRLLGAFSINRDSPRAAAESMRYAASLIGTNEAALWMYPQGVMLPNDSRPLQCYTGAARIAAMIGRTVQFVPFAHRYEFMMQQRPEAFTLYGAPKIVERVEAHKRLTEELEQRMTTLLDTLRCTIAKNDTSGFTTVLRGKRSTNETFDALRLQQ